MENTLTKEIFNREILEAASICILGHVSPDGDCVGSVLAAWNYITKLRKGEKIRIQAYLEPINEKFSYLTGSDCICSSTEDGFSYDLALVLDAADAQRLGKFRYYLDHAKKSIVIDHHITDPGYGSFNLVEGHASSACEVLYGLLDARLFDRAIAECIYTGVIHDTGVFRHNSTASKTLQVAAHCMEQGIDFNSIIEESFFSMTFLQKKVLGYLLTTMEQRLDGRMVSSVLDMEIRRAMGAAEMDMDGMIDQIRTTTGALIGVYLYETKDGRAKASLRSNSDLVDVSVIAAQYGGGGHKRAAGCFMPLDMKKDLDEIEAAVLKQLGEADEP